MNRVSIPGLAILAVERRDLAVDPVPIDLAGELNQLVLHVDDLVQPRPEQIVRSRRPVLLRSHRPLRCTTESWSAAKGNPKAKLQGLAASTSHSLQSQTASNPKKRLLLNRLEPCSRTTSSCRRLGPVAIQTRCQRLVVGPGVVSEFVVGFFPISPFCPAAAEVQ